MPGLVVEGLGTLHLPLGESCKLTAHLYKLLVYETGSFFLPHRDGEKLDRMVATLVVVLPSVHEGGALIVSHDGHQHEVTFSGAASGYELSYAAFYADCQHEVKPLESGYRLCLTYNVTLAKSRGKKGITAPSYESVVGKISALMTSWRNNPDSQKLAILLDHRYTRDGLSLGALKGVDRSQAEVLFEADLLVMIAAAKVGTLIRNAELLRLLCRTRDKNAERLELCARLCEGYVEALVTFDSQQGDDDWKIQQLDRAALLTLLVEAMLAIDAQSPLTRLIDHALNHRNSYKLNDVHLAVIFTLEPRFEKLAAYNEAVPYWLAACRQLLQERTTKPPKKPTDYRRVDKLSCTCVDCRVLSQFLMNPEQREIRMPLNKERRRHLHDVISSDRCDLTHVTERSGRPYTLVCTKTTASYGRASNIYERDLKSLARIMDMEKRVLAK